MAEANPSGVQGLRIRVGSWESLREPASAIRHAVFVREQGVPEQIEIDERDAGAVHAVAFDAKGEPLATGRLLPDARIGRMAVMPSARGRGVGALILRTLVDLAAARGEREVRLHAQCTAVEFYLRNGFVAEGPVYEEAGIPHQTMARALREPG
jgi:predicted GNAT family N-acyltransferase